MANAFTDFSGTWNGVCEINSKAQPSQKLISQIDDRIIEINGMKFDLTKPTVTTLEDVDSGQRYKEVTVYDWQWNEAKTTVSTSAKWVGWYLDQPGSWNGEGSGIIKIENNELITTRKFGNIDEVCTYPKESQISLTN